MHEVDTTKWRTCLAHINEIGVWHDDFHLTNIWDGHISSTKKTYRGHAWSTTQNKPCVWITVYPKKIYKWLEYLSNSNERDYKARQDTFWKWLLRNQKEKSRKVTNQARIGWISSMKHHLRFYLELWIFKNNINCSNYKYSKT